MKTIRIGALFLTLAVGATAQGATYKELTFEGVVSSGGDWTGNVFGTGTPAYLTGKAVSGRFVFNLDAMPGGNYYGGSSNVARYDDPVYPTVGAYGATGPFARAFITIDGYTHEIENKAQPSIPAPVRHTLSLIDSPGYAPWDALDASVISFRPQTCACAVPEFLDLRLTGLGNSFISGVSFAQNFDVLVNPGNLNSYAQFRILSGYQYGATYIPATPGWGNENYHYANADITLTRVSLRDLAVTAVPEPETYAMLLAGLGVMGAVSRRRQATPLSTT